MVFNATFNSNFFYATFVKDPCIINDVILLRSYRKLDSYYCRKSLLKVLLKQIKIEQITLNTADKKYAIGLQYCRK
jgi:hypothetical protein